MKSRHTRIKGRLCRSFGYDGDDDLVVELCDSGRVVFRREPATRKLRRGEKLPEVSLDVGEMFADMNATPPVDDAAALLEEVVRRVPIARFEDDNPRNVAYSMKVWLMKTLKTIIDEQKKNQRD